MTPAMAPPPHIFSVAPMMDWTDRHCRYFHRRLTRRALLYTEMITARALVRGRAHHLLDHHPAEAPLALQLGGSDSTELAMAARLGAGRGYAEINLNIGCPSDRVQSGCFGAVLMLQPKLVADSVRAMQDAAQAEVTVKCRIGVDDQDPHSALPRFLDAMQDAGLRRVIVHARKAWLSGLSPAQNRAVPPLDYGLVAREAAARPDLAIILNGGIDGLEATETHLAQGFAGVMLGRAAYHHPGALLLDADRRVFGARNPSAQASDAVLGMRAYIEAHVRAGRQLALITRHMLGLFSGQPGARAWRRYLSEHSHRPGSGWPVVADALGLVAEQGLTV